MMTNRGCQGYIQKVLQSMIDKNEIEYEVAKKIMRGVYVQFDLWTEAEAEEYYNNNTTLEEPIKNYIPVISRRYPEDPEKYDNDRAEININNFGSFEKLQIPLFQIVEFMKDKKTTEREDDKVPCEHCDADSCSTYYADIYYHPQEGISLEKRGLKGEFDFTIAIYKCYKCGKWDFYIG